MTEEQIERTVERNMDRLDASLMKDPTFTQALYDQEVKALDAWAEDQYRTLRRCG